MSENKEQHYKVLREIRSAHGRIVASIPGQEPNVIKASDLPEKDLKNLIDMGDVLEPYPKLYEESKKPIPKTVVESKNLEGKEYSTGYTDDELTLPTNFLEGKKLLKELREEVTDGLESYEKVERMIAKTQTMKDGKMKNAYLNELNKIMRTKPKVKKGD